MKIHEITPTIQGEGFSMGRDVVFIRLAICNLACSWCDTPFTWNWKKFDKAEEIRMMTVEEVFDEIHSHQRDAVVVSGGEPLLQQQPLIELCRLLKKKRYWIEIETNGTIVVEDELLAVVDQFNCSPKLSNSGSENSLKRRIRPDALDKLASTERTIFKFVISEMSDMTEVLKLRTQFSLKRVYLMAEGGTREEQDSHSKQVFSLSRQHGFYFTSRLHVQRWSDRRGC